MISMIQAPTDDEGNDRLRNDPEHQREPLNVFLSITPLSFPDELEANYRALSPHGELEGGSQQVRGSWQELRERLGLYAYLIQTYETIMKAGEVLLVGATTLRVVTESQAESA